MAKNERYIKNITLGLPVEVVEPIIQEFIKNGNFYQSEWHGDICWMTDYLNVKGYSFFKYSYDGTTLHVEAWLRNGKEGEMGLTGFAAATSKAPYLQKIHQVSQPLIQFIPADSPQRAQAQAEYDATVPSGNIFAYLAILIAEDQFMAIEYGLLLKHKKLSKEVLINKIEAMGYSCDHMEQLPGGIAVYLYEQAGFAVLLFDSHSTWDISFLEREFIAEKTLTFRWDKFYSDIEQQYKIMLKIIFELMDELNEEGVLQSSGGSELCFFRENGPILLNNESGIWDWKHFKDIIAGRDVAYIER